MQDPPCLVALNHVEVSGFLAPTPQLLLVHSIQIHSGPRFFLLESFNLQFWCPESHRPALLVAHLSSIREHHQVQKPRIPTIQLKSSTPMNFPNVSKQFLVG
jgi:hypothetical protein